MASQFFDRCRIIDDGKTPEFEVSGTRRVEFMVDGRVRLWICKDFPAVRDLMPGYCVPQVVLLMPVQNFVWNANAIAQFALDNNLASVRPIGPAQLRPHWRRMS